MKSSQFLSIFIIILAMIFSCGSSYQFHNADLHPSCPKDSSCGDHCDECEYGIVASPNCGFAVCAQGPDRYCDDENLCGEGLTCQCNSCHGCSTRKVAHKCSTARPCLHDSSLTTNEIKRMIMKRIFNQWE